MSAPNRRVFVDTNVLIYATRSAEPFSERARTALAAAEDSGDELCISRQVLREYLASVTRPQISPAPLPAALAVADVRRLTEIYIVLEDGPDVSELLFDMLPRVAAGGKQIHDANLVATMRAHRVRHLMTFNVDDFRRYAGIIDIVTP